MRRLIVPLLLISLAACSPTSLERKDAGEAEVMPVSAQGKRIELVNNARRGALVRFEVAAVEDREQFLAIPRAAGLAAEQERDVVLGPGCVYDMRAVMADGSTLRQYRVDVCFRARVFLLDFPAEGEPPQISAPPPEPPQ